MKNFTFLSLSFFLLTKCAGDDNFTRKITANEFPQTLTTRNFQINTPEGWKLIEGQGIDTNVGRIENENITINFDQGYLSFGNLERVGKTPSTLLFERLEINGVPAIIRKERAQNGQGNRTILTIFLDNGKLQNKLYIFDPPDDDFIIALFKTHKFLD